MGYGGGGVDWRMGRGKVEKIMVNFEYDDKFRVDLM